MFIGIDGGGTSTKVEIHRDGQSERRKYGPFNISAIGEEAFRKLLREMFADWGSLEECRAICVGGAGVSCGELEQIIREELKPTGFAGKLLLRSDSEGTEFLIQLPRGGGLGEEDPPGIAQT